MTKRRFNLGEEFVKLFRESIIVQSLATAMLLGTCCTIYLVPVFQGNQPGEIPSLLAGLTGTIIGHWFKVKAVYQASLEKNNAN